MAVPLRLATLHVWILNGNAVAAFPTNTEAINKSLFAEFVVFFVGDRLQPFVGSVFARDFKGEMRKPAVRRLLSRGECASCCGIPARK